MSSKDTQLLLLVAFLLKTLYLCRGVVCFCIHVGTPLNGLQVPFTDKSMFTAEETAVEQCD